jgi:hypothetical protein
MTSECLLEVILRTLHPCEVWGKVLVVLREDFRRRSGTSGYTTSDIKLLLKKKHGVDYKETDLKKVEEALIALKLMERVSTPDTVTPYHDLSPQAVVWADAILKAASGHDERFLPYVRTRKLEARTW